MTQYIKYKTGTDKVREGVRSENFVTDHALTETGFNGAENTDWENVHSINGDDATILKLYCDASVDQTVQLGLMVATGKTLYVDWGDGVVVGVPATVLTMQTFTHTYAGTSRYAIRISNATDITGININTGATIFDLITQEIYTNGGDIAEFYKCTALTTLILERNSVTPWTGSINGLNLGLTRLDLLSNETDGYVGNFNTCSGDISTFTSLVTLRIFGKNTISGSIAGLTSLVTVFLAGWNTVSGSINGLTSIQTLEGRGYTTVTGDIVNLTALKLICIGGSNTLTCSNIALLTNLEYYSAGGNLAATAAGSVAGLTSLYYF
jgi:hypothetical protein